MQNEKKLKLIFTNFDVDCDQDYVEITDWDGTILMNRTCGKQDFSYWYTELRVVDLILPMMLSSTNALSIFFHTDTISKEYQETDQRLGWSLTWVAITPGLMSVIHTLYPCDACMLVVSFI